MDNKIKIIADRITREDKVVVFTGAGISTESGISDYRSKGGIWDQFKPVYFDEFMSSKDARIKYWEQKTELYEDLVKAKPNAAHLALTKLHKMGRLRTVITQNIDGLHQDAGLSDDMVIELHGSNRRVRCMTCGEISSLKSAHDRILDGDLAPDCHCGGYLKPDTVSFGQSMPVAETSLATRLSQECGFFMVIGSTLLVQPAADMPFIAKRNGAFLCIINLSDTPCDEISDVVISEKAGEVMTRLLEEIEKI